MKNNRYLFLITLSYFALGFLNIHVALLGLLCMGIPLFILFKNRKKTWCQGYCPRACLYSTCGRVSGKWSRKTPLFFTKGPMKWIMLSYFGLSMTLIIVSTIAVAKGKPVADYLRFLLLFPLPNLPQLFSLSSQPWILHLSYRFYSMMLTTTTLGFILALVFKPRTWCTICPIATISEVYIKVGSQANKNIDKKTESEKKAAKG